MHQRDPEVTEILRKATDRIEDPESGRSALLRYHRYRDPQYQRRGRDDLSGHAGPYGRHDQVAGGIQGRMGRGGAEPICSIASTAATYHQGGRLGDMVQLES